MPIVPGFNTADVTPDVTKTPMPAKVFPIVVFIMRVLPEPRNFPVKNMEILIGKYKYFFTALQSFLNNLILFGNILIFHPADVNNFCIISAKNVADFSCNATEIPWIKFLMLNTLLYLINLL